MKRAALCSMVTLLGLLVFLIHVGAARKAASRYPWKGRTRLAKKDRLVQRISPPKGYSRRPQRAGTLAWWLRGLPLKQKGAPVMLYSGRRKPAQQHHVAVVDLDIGRRNLQQCADAIMRLWGEYLWSRGLQRYYDFKLGTGFSNPWWRWARGDRFRFRRRRIVGWRRRVKKADYSYRNFRRYLWFVMAWANTTSMTRQLKRIGLSKVQAGDILLVGWRGGSPGHAILLLDEVSNAKGERLFLLGQSYMPAQNFHVLKAPGQRTSPWYRFPRRGSIVTPEWTFTTKQFYRLPHRKGTR